MVNEQRLPAPTRYVLITVYPSGQEVRLETNKHPTLEWLQKQVKGYIECVKCSWRGHICDTIINEDGKILGLDDNYTATQAYAKLNGFGDYIVGAAVIFEKGRLK